MGTLDINSKELVEAQHRVKETRSTKKEHIINMDIIGIRQLALRDQEKN